MEDGYKKSGVKAWDVAKKILDDACRYLKSVCEPDDPAKFKADYMVDECPEFQASCTEYLKFENSTIDVAGLNNDNVENWLPKMENYLKNVHKNCKAAKYICNGQKGSTDEFDTECVNLIKNCDNVKPNMESLTASGTKMLRASRCTYCIELTKTKNVTDTFNNTFMSNYKKIKASCDKINTVCEPDHESDAAGTVPFGP